MEDSTTKPSILHSFIRFFLSFWIAAAISPCLFHVHQCGKIVTAIFEHDLDPHPPEAFLFSIDCFFTAFLFTCFICETIQFQYEQHPDQWGSRLYLVFHPNLFRCGKVSMPWSSGSSISGVAEFRVGNEKGHDHNVKRHEVRGNSKGQVNNLR